MSQPGSDDEGRSMDPLSYAHQFADILDRIDTQIFLPHQAAIEATLLPQFFPGQKSEGYHVQRVATYRVINPVRQISTKVPTVSAPADFYFIWGREVGEMAKRKLTGIGTLQKFGDADFRELLIACALMAVRYRVLQHKQLFPHAKLRTFASAFHDETIPEAHREQLRFLNKSQLLSSVLSDPLRLDALLLLTFVNMSEADGRPLEEALHYLTNT